jgi:hypothetical protein
MHAYQRHRVANLDPRTPESRAASPRKSCAIPTGGGGGGGGEIP